MTVDQGNRDLHSLSLFSPDYQQVDLWAAAESDSAETAYSPTHMDLARFPVSEPSHIALVPHRRESRPIKRHNHLSPMGVTAQHQVPGVGTECILAVRVVRQQHNRFSQVQS